MLVVLKDETIIEYEINELKQKNTKRKHWHLTFEYLNGNKELIWINLLMTFYKQ